MRTRSVTGATRRSMRTDADAWIEVLSSSPLFRGAEIRSSDVGIELSKGAARVLLAACESIPDVEALQQALAPGDLGLLMIGSAPSWLQRARIDQAPIALLPRD